MTDRDNEVAQLLARIERNQARALEVQEKQLAIAQAHFDKTHERIEESLRLQRVAVERQKQYSNFAIPAVLLLLALVGYLLVRWKIL